MAEYEKSYMGDMNLKDYYDILGEEGKKVFLEWLTKKNPYCKEHKEACINYDFSLDYKNDVYRVGRNLVYLYTDENGLPFYVGEGTSFRAKSTKSRNESFLERLNSCSNYKVFAIAHNINKEGSQKIETLVINELLNRGWRLTNSRQTTVTSEKMLALLEDYSDVIGVINNITKNGLHSLLTIKKEVS